jgi:hypothetical protein
VQGRESIKRRGCAARRLSGDGLKWRHFLVSFHSRQPVSNGK